MASFQSVSYLLSNSARSNTPLPGMRVLITFHFDGLTSRLYVAGLRLIRATFEKGGIDVVQFFAKSQRKREREKEREGKERRWNGNLAPPDMPPPSGRRHRPQPQRCNATLPSQRATALAAKPLSGQHGQIFPARSCAVRSVIGRRGHATPQDRDDRRENHVTITISTLSDKIVI